MAVLLGHGRGGELDQGEGPDPLDAGHRPRPHHRQPASHAAQVGGAGVEDLVFPYHMPFNFDKSLSL